MIQWPLGPWHLIVLPLKSRSIWRLSLGGLPFILISYVFPCSTWFPAHPSQHAKFRKCICLQLHQTVLYCWRVSSGTRGSITKDESVSRGNPCLLPRTVRQCKLLYISTASIIPTVKSCSTDMGTKERRKIFGVILTERRVASSQTPVLEGQKEQFNIIWCQFVCMTENSIRRNNNTTSACSTGSSGTPWRRSTAGSRMGRKKCGGWGEDATNHGTARGLSWGLEAKVERRSCHRRSLVWVDPTCESWQDWLAGLPGALSLVIAWRASSSVLLMIPDDLRHQLSCAFLFQLVKEKWWRMPGHSSWAPVSEHSSWAHLSVHHMGMVWLSIYLCWHTYTVPKYMPRWGLCAGRWGSLVCAEFFSSGAHILIDLALPLAFWAPARAATPTSIVWVQVRQQLLHLSLSVLDKDRNGDQDEHE